MWSFPRETLPDVRGVRCTVLRDGIPASFADVIEAWGTDPDFCTLFNSVLADGPFHAYRWETPCVTTATLGRPFEFVVLDSPGLDRRPDPAAFAEHFTDPNAEVVTFTNLGGDAMLVVPCPRADESAYGHLGRFVWFAPGDQRCARSSGRCGRG